MSETKKTIKDLLDIKWYKYIAEIWTFGFVNLCGMTQIKTAKNQISKPQLCTHTIFIAKRSLSKWIFKP